MLRRKIIGIALFLFLLLALSHSFVQFSVMRLDGDIAESVLPYPDVQKTFDDPTGIKTIINNDKHVGANRFFSHYFLHKTFRELPFLLQNFCNPIDSVYYTSAIAKLIMLIMLLFLFTVIINGKTNVFSLKFIVTVALLIPFFQINGRHLYHEIGIIDRSVTYSFFYAMPLIFLLSYYVPIFLEFLHDKKNKMNWILIILWGIFAIISCFSSPIIPPTILITNVILFFYIFVRNWKANKGQFFLRKVFNAFKIIPGRIYWFLLPISFLALYSLFLGTYNDAFSAVQLPLKDLYLLLPKGILRTFTFTSYSIITGMLVMNYLIIFYKYKGAPQYKKIVGLYRFLIVFSVIYVLLLPLGGYRSYRPYILRYDTIIPITVLSIITVCYTFLFIVKQLKTDKWKYHLKTIYLSTFFIIFIFLLYKNKLHVCNECEKSSLHTMAQLKEDVVVLDSDCCVISWEQIDNQQYSKAYAELIYFWNITDKVKLYYNSQ